MNLYPRKTLWASCGILLIGIIGLSVVMAQRKSQHKLRATALVELTTDARGHKTVRVIPITILDQGNFHDASIYKGAPEPMALGTGVVYEAEKTGVPVGFATVSNAAVHNGTWTAEGKWQAETDKPKPKSTATPANPADERPVLRRGGQAASTTSSEPSSSPQSGSSDRPVLHKKADDAPPSSTPSPQASASPSGSDDRPVLHKKSDEPSSSATPAAEASASPSPAAAPAVTPEAQSASEDPNRPTLRRGMPVPTPEKANATPNPASAKSAKAVSTSSPGTQTYVAVSDAAADDSRSFQFMWKAGEEAPIDTKLKQLAAERLAKSEGKTGSAAIEQALKNVVIRSFDLDLSNDAVLVLTAEVPPAGSSGAVKPVAKGQAASKEASATPPAATKYVTLITRVDLDGNPQVLASSVTDSSRLDIAPRLEFVDAVDVDGDGIGELLFREYDFDQATFVVYAVRHGTLTKLFEGASQPLK